MRSESTLSFAPDHPAFAGHFPSTPVVPGVLLLDAVIHAMQELRPPESAGATTCQVTAVKFLSPVGPGELLDLVLDIAQDNRARFEISCSGRKVASGSLAWGAGP